MPRDSIAYSSRYNDGVFEYRHVILPMDLAAKLPPNRLLTETEWRNLGVQQSRGWVHFMIHRPEPYILIFRRSLPKEVAETQAAVAANEARLNLHAVAALVNSQHPDYEPQLQ